MGRGPHGEGPAWRGARMGTNAGQGAINGHCPAVCMVEASKRATHTSCNPYAARKQAPPCRLKHTMLRCAPSSCEASPLPNSAPSLLMV
jgi:hypothetical protein